MIRLILSSKVSLLHWNRPPRQGLCSSCHGAAAWAGVGLVNDDGKWRPRCSADFCSRTMEAPARVVIIPSLLPLSIKHRRSPRAFSVPHSSPHLGKPFDSVPDLRVQYTTVGYNNNGIEHRFSILRKYRSWLGGPARQWSWTYRFAGGMLNKIPPARAVPAASARVFAPRRAGDSGGRSAGAVSWPVLLSFFHNKLSIVFEDVGGVLAGEYLRHMIIGLEPTEG